jgi:Kdo2-lipid IVA lauroyltransferase/acyltransferase
MQLIAYLFIRGFLACISFLNISQIQKLALSLTPLCYRLISKYRKRALSNLALAKDLKLTNDQIKDISKKSLYHLLVTAFEYGFLYKSKSIQSFCHCINPEDTDHLLDEKKGVIFFCGHQSNWELLFLDATSRHFGVCIGKPIKNKRLYNFILNIRQKFLGSVIVPKDAYKGCMRALKKGELVGVVGDQGLTESSFTYDCLGRKAYMTTLPALLSVRSGAPVYVASILRKTNGYEITYTGPILPDSQSQDPIYDITLKSLNILDEKIKLNPEQWMWQHNRWKIPYKSFIPKKYKHDAIACVVSSSLIDLEEELKLLSQTYEGAYLIIFKPTHVTISCPCNEVIDYISDQDCLIEHFGPKLLIDLVGIKGMKDHYKKLSLFEYIRTSSIKELIKNWKDAHAH